MGKKVIYLTIIAIVLLFGFNANAGSSKEVLTTLDKLDQLVSINYDQLDTADETKIYVKLHKKEEKSCFCACRTPAWSCTSIQCNKHNKECSNVEEEDS